MMQMNFAEMVQNILAIFAKSKKESEKSEEWRNTWRDAGKKAEKQQNLEQLHRKEKIFAKKY